MLLQVDRVRLLVGVGGGQVRTLHVLDRCGAGRRLACRRERARHGDCAELRGPAAQEPRPMRHGLSLLALLVWLVVPEIATASRGRRGARGDHRRRGFAAGRHTGTVGAIGARAAARPTR
jgi:hypothetical protein